MILRRLKEEAHKRQAQQVWQLILAAFTVGVIVWALVEIFQHQCLVSQIPLDLNQNCSQLPWDLIPIMIALVFWIVGLIGWHYQWGSVALEFFFVCSATLVTGEISGLGLDLANRLFYILLACLGPLMIRFHYSWLNARPGSVGNFLYKLILFSSLASCIPFFIWNYKTLVAWGVSLILKSIVRLFVLMAIGLTIVMIASVYRRDMALVTRYRARLVFFGIILAIAPLTLLYVIPHLVGEQFIPAEYNFPWLLIIPLAYGYSILRPNLVKSESIVIQVILYFLLVIFILCILLFASTIINQFSGWKGAWIFFGLLLTIVGVWIYNPIRQALGQFVMWILYGGGNQSIYILEQTSDDILTRVLDRDSLGELLVNKLMQSVPLSGVGLLLVDRDDRLVKQTAMRLIIPTFLYYPEMENIHGLDFFIQVPPLLTSGDLAKSGWYKSLTQDQQNKLSISGIDLWIPLISNNQLFGLLLFGKKLNNDFFTLEDRRVIQILAHNAGVAAYNILLVEDIYEGRKELAKAHQQLLTAQDKAQSRLARDLHDTAIQQLIGLSYQINEIRKKINNNGDINEDSGKRIQGDLKAMQVSILEVATQLRLVIKDLRPVGLDDLGLVEALEGYLIRLQSEPGQDHQPTLEWDFEKPSKPIPYPLKINLFRINQELVNNAIVHAAAKCIKVGLHFNGDDGTLEVVDDGKGFIVPDRLSQFAQSDHFGLLGINERVSGIDGKFTITSQIDKGTRIAVQFRL